MTVRLGCSLGRSARACGSRDEQSPAPPSVDRQLGPEAHEDVLCTRLDEEIDECLRQLTVDLMTGPWFALPRVTARVVDVDVETVLM